MRSPFSPAPTEGFSQRRLSFLHELVTLSQQSAASLSYEHVLRRAAQVAQTLMPAGHCSVMLYDVERLRLRTVAHYPEHDQLDGVEIPLDVPSVAAEALKASRPVFVRDLEAEAYVQPRELGVTELTVVSMLAVPIRFGEATFGVLNLGEPRRIVPDPTDIELLSLLGVQAAIAIKNASQGARDRRQLQTYDALYRLSRALQDAPELERVLGLVLDEVKTLVPHDMGVLLLKEGDDFCPRASQGIGPGAARAAEVNRYSADRHALLRAVLAGDEALLIDDVRRDPRWVWLPSSLRTRAWMGVPLKVGERPVGALTLGRTRARPFSPDDARTLIPIAAHAAVLLENLKLYEGTLRRNRELSRLSERQSALQEAERRRVANFLHDEVAQLLSATALQLEGVGRAREAADERTNGALRKARRLLGQAVEQVRTLSHELHPAALETLGLTKALASLARTYEGSGRLRVSLEVVSALPPLQPAHELLLYRAAQEGLQNVVKHAGSARAWVRLRREAGGVSLSVRDAGRGAPAAGPAFGLGLVSLRERAAQLGGQLALEANDGGGAVLLVWLPGA